MGIETCRIRDNAQKIDRHYDLLPRFTFVIGHDKTKSLVFRCAFSILWMPVKCVQVNVQRETDRSPPQRLYNPTRA